MLPILRNMCQALLAYVVLQCDVEGNKAGSAQRGRERNRLYLFSLIHCEVKLYLTLPNTPAPLEHVTMSLFTHERP